MGVGSWSVCVVLVLVCGWNRIGVGQGGGCVDRFRCGPHMFDVTSTSGNNRNNVWKELRVHVAPEPTCAAGTPPITAAAFIETTVTDDVSEPGPVPERSPSERPRIIAPRTGNKIISEVPSLWPFP